MKYNEISYRRYILLSKFLLWHIPNLSEYDQWYPDIDTQWRNFSF